MNDSGTAMLVIADTPALWATPQQVTFSFDGTDLTVKLGVSTIGTVTVIDPTTLTNTDLLLYFNNSLGAANMHLTRVQLFGTAV